MRFSVGSASVLVLAVVAACAEAGGEVRGGDLTDIGPAVIAEPRFVPPGNPCLAFEDVNASTPVTADAGAAEDAGDAGDAGDDDGGVATPVDAGAGATVVGAKWSDLYRDIFGPTGRPGSCVANGTCHGTPEGTGAQTSGALQCFDEKGCWNSMVTMSGGVYVTPRDAASSALLTGLLRTCKEPALGPSAPGNVVGFMPKQPADFFYPPASIARIAAWINSGAPPN